jgi:hypothetical protein
VATAEAVKELQQFLFLQLAFQTLVVAVEEVRQIIPTQEVVLEAQAS